MNSTNSAAVKRLTGTKQIGNVKVTALGHPEHRPDGAGLCVVLADWSGDLVCIMAGIKPMELLGRIGAWFDGMKGQMGNPFDTKVSGSGNHVFDEYQQTQMDRIEEIKAEVRDRSDRFNSFKGDEERQRQQEQFDRFMGRPQQD